VTTWDAPWVQPGEAPTQIEGNLWIGAFPQPWVRRQFDYIVSVVDAKFFPEKPGQIHVCMPFEDSPDVKPVYFHAIADLAHRFVQDRPTLVHCQHGYNRSGVIVALTLLRMGWEPERAVNHIREKRGASALSNYHFRNWILSSALRALADS